MKSDKVLETIKDFNENYPVNVYEKNSVSGHVNLICNAAEQKGLVVKKIGKNTFFLDNGRIVGGLHGMKPHTTSFLAVTVCAQKDRTKSILSCHNIPVPKGKTFNANEYEKALSYVQERNRKIVVKPVNLSKGKGISVNVDSDLFYESWRYCIEEQVEAGKKNPQVMIEDYHKGFEIRVLVIECKFFCAMIRLPANVIGDGVSSIRSLIKKKNEQRKLNPHLNKLPIVVDSHGEKLLESQGFSLDSIPPKGKVVILNKKTNISSGGDNIDITDSLCDGLKELAVRAVTAIPGLKCAGVDIITASLDHPDDAVVIEVNTNANFGIHHYPMFGMPRNPANALIKSFIADQNEGIDWEERFFMEENLELNRELQKIKNENKKIRNELHKTKYENKILKEERDTIKYKYNKILISRTWRYTQPIRKLLNFFKTYRI